jgi:hypothetical protein
MSAPETIITTIPSDTELALQNRPHRQFTLEPISQSLMHGYDPSDPNANPVLHMLTRMRGQLQWGPEESHNRLVEDAYAVARNIGDQAIAERDQVAWNLLDGTRSHARYGMKFFGKTTDGNSEKSLSAGMVWRSTHDGVFDGEFGVNVGEAYRSGTTRQAVEQRLQAGGINFDPQDVSLFIFLQITAHEAGHMIQNGVGEVIPKQAVGGEQAAVPGPDRMSSHVLASKPDAMLTGNLKTDSRIYDERFAEGYGMLVVQEAAKLLGYDEKAAAALTQALSITGDSMKSRELLGQVSADKSLAEIMKEQGIDGYFGELGYLQPLSLDEITADLHVLNDALKARRAYSLTQEQYSALVSQKPTASNENVPGVPEMIIRRRTRIRSAAGRVGLRLKSLRSRE